MRWPARFAASRVATVGEDSGTNIPAAAKGKSGMFASGPLPISLAFGFWNPRPRLKEPIQQESQNPSKPKAQTERPPSHPSKPKSKAKTERL